MRHIWYRHVVRESKFAIPFLIPIEGSGAKTFALKLVNEGIDFECGLPESVMIIIKMAIMFEVMNVDLESSCS